MDVAFSETGAVSHCMVMKLPDCQGPSAQPGAQTPRARKSRADFGRDDIFLPFADVDAARIEYGKITRNWEHIGQKELNGAVAKQSARARRG